MTLRTLVFATRNPDKTHEIKEKLPQAFQLLSLADIDFQQEIIEDQATLKGNALKKAKTVFQATGYPCFADDTGLEVDALNGAPGVYSARYAGNNATDEDNVALLLKNMQGKENRQARFKTVIALVLENEKEYLFEGITEGFIPEERRGEEGFGYDPVFRPRGYEHSYAEMSLQEKNRLSHRGKAVEKMVNFLASKQ